MTSVCFLSQTVRTISQTVWSNLIVLKDPLDKGSNSKAKDNYGTTVVDMIKKKMEGDPARWKRYLDLVEATL